MNSKRRIIPIMMIKKIKIQMIQQERMIRLKRKRVQKNKLLFRVSFQP